MRSYDRVDVKALRRVFDGAGPASAIGVALVALGTIFVFVVLSSPGAWQWFGARAVAGQESGGVVTYTYQGHNYSLDDVRAFGGSGAKTVYLNPANPTEATLGVTVAEVSYTAFVALPYLMGVGFLTFAFVRRRRIRKRSKDWEEYGPLRPYGSGIDSETVKRLIARRGHPPLQP